MRIAMLGTRGVPARYGGFETCVEEVGTRLAKAGHDVTVYCRRTSSAQTSGDESSGTEERSTYQGMSLVHLPATRRRSLETLSHTSLSVGHLLTGGTDVALVFNAANSPLLPVLRARRIPIATHVDGLEWKRTKWGGAGRSYYRLAESLAVRWSDALIADAGGISDYYRDEFGAATDLISYGAPLVDLDRPELLEEVGLTPRGYHLVVARFEPENHVDVIVEGYVSSRAAAPLVVVGSAPYSDQYTAMIRSAADERVRFFGGVWDQDLLDQMYAGCLSYLHGHSVGGTNPSLLRALGAGAATDAYDVSFNREVLGEAGRFWMTSQNVAELVESAEAAPDEVRRRGELARDRAADYDWDEVASQYEQLCRRLAHSRPGRRPSGRRAPAAAHGSTTVER